MPATASARQVRSQPRVTTRPRPALRLVPAQAPSTRRGPFIILMLALVIVGTIGLLVLNTVIAAGSFRVEQLTQANAELAVTEQSLQRQIADGLSPQALAAAAHRLGMIPAGQPGFILFGPDGSVVIQGTPVPAGVG